MVLKPFSCCVSLGAAARRDPHCITLWTWRTVLFHPYKKPYRKKPRNLRKKLPMEEEQINQIREERSVRAWVKASGSCTRVGSRGPGRRSRTLRRWAWREPGGGGVQEGVSPGGRQRLLRQGGALRACRPQPRRLGGGRVMLGEEICASAARWKPNC